MMAHLDLRELVIACGGEVRDGAGDVDLDELAGADLLLLERSFSARRVLDAALDAEQLGVEPRAEFASPVVAQAVAASGRGVCVLTDDPRFGLVPLTIRDADGDALGIRHLDDQRRIEKILLDLILEAKRKKRI